MYRSGSRAVIRRTHVVLSAIVMLSTVAGCASNDPHRGAKIGGLVGTVAGMTAGAGLSGPVLVYTVVEGGAGFWLGSKWDEARRVESRDDESAAPGTPSEASVLPAWAVRRHRIHFDPASSDLRPEEAPILERAAALLRDRAALHVRVVGHASRPGRAEYNMDLSRRRAEAVAAAFAARGIERSRIDVSARGEELADEEDERARDRRVEISIVVAGNPAERLASE